jgi:aldehyde dehydrogenase (NAD+)
VGGGGDLPFTGVGKSGYSREKGFRAIEEFFRTKKIMHHFG